MTTARKQTLVRKMVLGLAVGTAMMGAVTARAATDVACFGAVVDLYLAQRASGALDYVVCKATCQEMAPADRSACRLGCRRDRTATARESREEAGALRTVCEGAGGDAQQRSAEPVPSTCGPALSDCAVDVRASAKACDGDSDDLTTLSACAADVSAAADQCGTDFVECALPVE